jgi:hypothetical protein
VDVLNLDARLGTAEGALAVGVSKHTVRKWRTEGWIDLDTQQRRTLPTVGTDRSGNPLHRYGDLLAAERDTRRSGKSHRGAGTWAAMDRKAA